MPGSGNKSNICGGNRETENIKYVLHGTYILEEGSSTLSKCKIKCHSADKGLENGW